LSEITIKRCNSDGSNNTSGKSAKLKFKWACDKTVSSIEVRWESANGDEGSTTISASGTSGSVDSIIGEDKLSTELAYTIYITITDSGGYFVKNLLLNGLKMPIDVLYNGNGVAFGKTSEMENTADFGFDVMFRGAVFGNAVGLANIPIQYKIPNNSDINDYLTPGCYYIEKNAEAETMTNLPTAAAGKLFVCEGTGTTADITAYAYRNQIFIPYLITRGIYVRAAHSDGNSAWTFNSWYKIGLTEV
jgi:hypothetical protein